MVNILTVAMTETLSAPTCSELIRGARSCNEFYVHMTVHCNKVFFSETNRCTCFQIYSCTKIYMFWVGPLPIIRSWLLYIQHWYML
jgi:hypothetical protein